MNKYRYNSTQHVVSPDTAQSTHTVAFIIITQWLGTHSSSIGAVQYSYKRGENGASHLTEGAHAAKANAAHTHTHLVFHV